jgi:hypothetical protein
MKFTQLTANLAGSARRETLNGREYLVVPISLIVPGVLNGSKGALYYPHEEIVKNVEAWNGIPIVLNHPSKDGKPVSARTPEIYNKSVMGFLMNAEGTDKLRAEGWFDIEQTAKVDNRVLQAVQNNTPIEVSTGLHTDIDTVENGSFNGVSYTSIARNYTPDHLAILPDAVGACSIKDGCGLSVNEADKTTLEPKTNPKEGLISRIMNSVLSLNKLSHDETHSQLRDQVRDKFQFGITDDIFIEEVFDKSVVFFHRNTTWEIGYTKSKDIVTLSTEQPVEVVRVITYKPVTNEQTMTTKETKIEELIANSCDGCFGEKDRTILEGLEETQLDAFIKNLSKEPVIETPITNSTSENILEEPKMTEPIKTVETPIKNKQMTHEEFMRQAPPEVVENLKYAADMKQAEKQKLVDKITANSEEGAKASHTELLMKKPISELEMLATIVANTTVAVAAKPMNFSGNVTAPTQNAEEYDRTDPFASTPSPYKVL